MYSFNNEYNSKIHIEIYRYEEYCIPEMTWYKTKILDI